jgi:DNA transformation protein and related proteins
VVDQLEELGDVTSKRMFGGVGLYYRGVFFGILADDTAYFKVDEANRADYARAGMKAFRPFPDRAGSMNYYEVPLAILESPFELVEWARRSIAVAKGSSGLKNSRASRNSRGSKGSKGS